jgi:hypothetical protein
VKILKYLSDGQKKRALSDYSVEVSFDKEIVEAQIEHAQKFIILGEEYFNPPSSQSLDER